MIIEKTFNSKELQINYAEGPDNGPPIILLHGTTNRWQAFLPIIPYLVQRWHIYAPDFRGHGKSGRALKYGFENYTNDIINFLEVVVKEPAVLFGHSLGGRVALKIADIRKPLTRAIILGDSSLNTPRRSGGLGAGFSQILELLEKSHKVHEIYEALLSKEGENYDHVMALTRAKNISMVDPAMLRSIIEHSDPEDPESHFNGYSPDIHLKNVRCPVLILRAEKGMLSDQEIEKALEILPESYCVLLKGAPHEFLTRDSEPIVKALNAFLEFIL